MGPSAVSGGHDRPTLCSLLLKEEMNVASHQLLTHLASDSIACVDSYVRQRVLSALPAECCFLLASDFFESMLCDHLKFRL